MSKKTIIKGTIILTITGLLTKLLGFYNRIFLTRIIGVKELGIYQLIFPLYMLSFAICVHGVSTALTKQVSYFIGKKSPCDAKQVFKSSLVISITLSIIVSILLNIFAYPLSLHILKNTDCMQLLKTISIAIPFVALKSCINAYFIGIDKPGYHGISHFIEQIFRIGTTYLLACFWSNDMLNAKLAVTAIVIGEITATIFAVIFYKLYIIKNKKKFINYHKNKINKKLIYINFLHDALPITSNNLLFTLFSSFETIIMPAMLFKYYHNNDLSMELYGIVTGIVIPFLLFPSTITTSLSTMLLPAVSYAKAQKNENAIKTALKNSILFCIFLGICAWFVYLLFGEIACEFAFKNKTAGTLLKKISFMCPLIYLSGNLSAIMNGIDKAFTNLMFNIISISIRIMFSIIFVPNFGIIAYIYGLTTSYIVLDILLLFAVFNRNKTSKTRVHKV